MSHTSVYAVYKTKAVRIDSFQNSKFCGPVLWNYISNKLYGEDFNCFDDEEFWGSYKDSRLSKKEKAVLLCTLDKAFIEVDHLEEFSKACYEVHKAIDKGNKYLWNHFLDIGMVSACLLSEHDHRLIGMAVAPTSVDDLWLDADVKKLQPIGVYGILEGLK